MKSLVSHSSNPHFDQNQKSKWTIEKKFAVRHFQDATKAGAQEWFIYLREMKAKGEAENRLKTARREQRRKMHGHTYVLCKKSDRMLVGHFFSLPDLLQSFDVETRRFLRTHNFRNARTGKTRYFHWTNCTFSPELRDLCEKPGFP